MMALLDEYIKKAAKALRCGDGGTDALCREIIDVIGVDYTPPGLWATLNTASFYSYTKSDLERILGKLRLKREEQDMETYADCGLITVTQHIRALERAEEDGLQGEDLKAVYDSMDKIYANYYESYTDGLVAFGYSGDPISDEQTELRIEKLKLFRDEELRKLKMSEALRAGHYTVQNNYQNSNATATANVSVSQEITFEQIENLSDDILTDDEKAQLKGMLANLQTKDGDKRKDRLKKVLSWLADKGVDVFNAAMPYIVQLIQSQTGK